MFGQDDAQGPDLGFEIGEDTNLFELFAKGQDGDTTKAVDLTAADDKSKAPPKTDPPADADKTGTDADAPDKDKEPAVNAEKLRQMMEADIKGDKQGASAATDGDDTGAGKTPDGEDKPPTAVAVVYADFKEKGIIQVPDDFEFDGTEEGLQEAIQVTVQNQLADAVDQTIEEAFSKRPEQAEVAKELIKFLGAGGTVTDFVANRGDYAVKAEDLDAEDETTRVTAAKKTITAYYRDVMKWDDARIKRQIDRSIAKGEDILVDEAKDVLEEYQTTMKQRRADAQKALDEAETKRKQNLVTFNTQLSDTIDKADEIAGFKLTGKKDREALRDYLFKPTVELNGKKVPQYLADRHRLANDPNYVLAQALLMKNNMTPNTKAITTKVVGKLEQTLSDLQKGKKVTGTAGQGADRSDRTTPGILDFDNLDVVTIR